MLVVTAESVDHTEYPPPPPRSTEACGYEVKRVIVEADLGLQTYLTAHQQGGTRNPAPATSESPGCSGDVRTLLRAGSSTPGYPWGHLPKTTAQEQWCFTGNLYA